MRHINLSLLGKVKWWAASTALCVGLLTFAINIAPTLAAPGDAGDPNGIWQNSGALKFDGRTYVSTNTQYKGAPVFAVPNTPTCNTGTETVPQAFLRITANSQAAEKYTSPNTTLGNGAVVCVPATSGTITLSNTAAQSALFFQDGDVIYTFNKSGSFKKGANGPGGEEMYYNGTGQCVDAISKATDGTWSIYPMAPRAEVESSFPLNGGIISERYATLIGDTTGTSRTNCRVNSIELSTQVNGYRLLAMPTNEVTIAAGVLANECEEAQGIPPARMVNFGDVTYVVGPTTTPGSFRTDFIDPGIPVYVTQCRIVDINNDHDQSTYVYAATVSVNNKLLLYSKVQANSFVNISDDDGYRIVAGVATAVPDATPGIPTSTNPGGPAGAPAQICEDDSSGLAHILCPIIRGIDALMQNLFQNIIVPFLAVPPLTTIPGLQAAWQNVLGISNILFIIVFFIIIFSQATSVGVSNYGVKKLLPKLIAIAILSNISFFICAFAVDFSNILGAGISSLILVPLQGLPNTGIQFSGGFEGVVSSVVSIQLIGAAVAAQGGLVAAVAALAVLIALLLLVSVLLLLARQVLVMAFVIFSPIIFIGFILPGTTRIANRATVGFLNLLWVSPIVMALVALDGFVIYILNVVMGS